MAARGEHPSPGAVGLVAAVVGLLSLFGLYTPVNHQTNLDDLFIVFVYARHFVESGSFYWNACCGVVDGFTSFLDLMETSLLYAFAGDGVFRAVWLASIVSHTAVAAGVVGVVIGLGRSRAALGVAGLAGLSLGWSKALGDSTQEMLETNGLALLALGAVALVPFRGQRFRGQAGALGGVLVLFALTRPEGMALALLLLAGVAWLCHRRGIAGFGRAAAIAFACGVVPYLLWRVAYFGDLAPNTYYAKTSASRWNEIVDGTEFLRLRLGHAPTALRLAAALALPLFCLRRRPSERAFACLGLGLLTLASVAIAVVAGGDSYRASARLLLLPELLAVLTLAAAFFALESRTRWVGPAVLAASCALQALPVADGATRKLAVIASAPARYAERWACERQALEELARRHPGGVIGQSDFQRAKFFLDDATVLDFHGLNDREIAHERWEEPVRWGKSRIRRGVEALPDVWFLGFRYFHDAPMDARPLAEILASRPLSLDWIGHRIPERLHAPILAHYRAASVPSCGRHLNYLARVSP